MPYLTNPTHIRRRFGGGVLAVSVGGLLAMMPAGASASATSVTPASVTVTSGELGTVKVNALGLEAGQLASVLAQIPALGALPSGQLTTIVGALPQTSTLQTVLNTVKALTGVEVTAGEATQVLLKNAAANPAILANVLSDVAALLHGTPQAAQLTTAVEGLIDGLTPAQLQQLETQLGLSGTPAQLANSLLEKLANRELPSIGELSTVLSELGTTASTTGAGLAGAAGTTPAALADVLGLPESVLSTASGTDTPLGSLRGFFTVLGNPEGVTVGTVPNAPVAGGSTSTTTTNGSSTTASSTTIAPASVPPASKSTVKAAKVKIISHKVKGHVLTLVVRVPSAGKLTASAPHLKGKSKKAAKAQTITLKLALTKAGIASIGHHHHKVNPKVKVTFRPSSGATSSASTTVHFR